MCSLFVVRRLLAVCLCFLWVVVCCVLFVVFGCSWCVAISGVLFVVRLLYDVCCVLLVMCSLFDDFFVGYAIAVCWLLVL